MKLQNGLMGFLFAASLALVACGGTARDDGSSGATGASEGALTSVALEKSHIEVNVDQTSSKAPGDAECTIRSVTYRISYENPSLPAGTKIVAHVGHTSSTQQYIGDGFGWGEYHTAKWTDPVDLDMKRTGKSYEVEVDGQAYGPYTKTFDLGFWQSHQEGSAIQFVFRLELPNGQVLWDNRLDQDYEATSPSPVDCAHVSRSAGSWGPF